MSTVIHNIDQISCSLYVGDQVSIYSFSYDYDPRAGTKITIYFVSQGGTYNVPTTINQNATILSVLQKTQITIGTALFSMYPLSYGLDMDVSRKILKVDFVDDTFQLDNYYIVLTGQGCGDHVYALGLPVDSRTDAQRVSAALDPLVQNVKNQAITLDVEYHFSDFIGKLGLAFPRSVIVTASWDDTITKPFVGSFRDVLDAWVKYHNLVYYFEEGSLTICNPQSLNITFPTIPLDAITAKQSESLENTFTATANATFNQDGGQYGANGVGNDASSLTLYPAGAEFNLPQQQVDMNQVAAAAYGIEYWFVYNYIQGSATTECGWSPILLTQVPAGSLFNSLCALLGGAAATNTTAAQPPFNTVAGNGGIAYIDEDVLAQRFNFYSEYGKSIAGRYYLSDDQGGSIYSQQTYKWFDQTNGQSFNLAALLNSNTPQIPIEFYLEGINDGGLGYVENSQINRYYPGVQANGNRLVFKDTRNVDLKTPFALTEAQKGLLQTYYKNLVTVGVHGGDALDYSQVGGGNVRYIVYHDQVIDQSIPYSPSDDQVAIFNSAHPQINLVGVKAGATIQANAPNSFNNLITNVAGASVANIGTVTTVAQPSSNLYFSRYVACSSQSSLSKAGARGAYKHRYVTHPLSVDSPTPFSVTKGAVNAYTLARDLSLLPTNAAILAKICTPQIQSRKQLDFSLNYFYPGIPTSKFISNGLTSMSVSISEGGVSSSYTFSNSMLDVAARDDEAFFDTLAKNMRNSWVRQYNPDQTASF